MQLMFNPWMSNETVWRALRDLLLPAFRRRGFRLSFRSHMRRRLCRSGGCGYSAVQQVFTLTHTRRCFQWFGQVTPLVQTLVCVYLWVFCGEVVRIVLTLAIKPSRAAVVGDWMSSMGLCKQWKHNGFFICSDGSRISAQSHRSVSLYWITSSH